MSHLADTPTRALAALTVTEWYMGLVEKRSQLIENTLEPGSLFMKLRAPQALRDLAETDPLFQNG